MWRNNYPTVNCRNWAREQDQTRELTTATQQTSDSRKLHAINTLRSWSPEYTQALTRRSNFPDSKSRNSTSIKALLTFLVLNLSLHIVDSITALDLQGDSLAREGLHEDLHLDRRPIPATLGPILELAKRACGRTSVDLNPFRAQP